MYKGLFIAALLASSPIWAGPAPWYKWHSTAADHQVCSQTSPGEGWQIIKGPFRDAHCQKPGVPD